MKVGEIGLEIYKLMGISTFEQWAAGTKFRGLTTEIWFHQTPKWRMCCDTIDVYGETQKEVLLKFLEALRKEKTTH